MDALCFTVEIAKALAWPVAAVSIALIFRKQIQILLLRMKKGKFGPAEVEFEEGVRALEETASAALPKEAEIAIASSDAIENPRTVVLEAWLRVEASLEALGRLKGWSDTLGGRDFNKFVRSLQDTGLLEPSFALLYRELRQLRNRATHDIDFTPSPQSVVRYASLAKALESRIRELTQSPNQTMEPTR